jgi:hypothetical protein
VGRDVGEDSIDGPRWWLEPAADGFPHQLRNLAQLGELPAFRTPQRGEHARALFDVELVVVEQDDIGRRGEYQRRASLPCGSSPNCST